MNAVAATLRYGFPRADMLAAGRFAERPAVNCPQSRLQPVTAENRPDRSLALAHDFAPDAGGPVADQHATGGNRMYPHPFGRKLPKQVNHPSKEEVKARLADALSDAAPKYRVHAKDIGRAVEASPDAAEGWRSGLNIPGGYYLILLARQFPEVKAAVRQLMDMDHELDPKAYAMFIELQRYVQRRAAE
jgi:hypothetical protein